MITGISVRRRAFMEKGKAGPRSRRDGLIWKEVKGEFEMCVTKLAQERPQRIRDGYSTCEK